MSRRPVRLCSSMREDRIGGGGYIEAGMVSGYWRCHGGYRGEGGGIACWVRGCFGAALRVVRSRGIDIGVGQLKGALEEVWLAMAEGRYRESCIFTRT